MFIVTLVCHDNNFSVLNLNCIISDVDDMLLSRFKGNGSMKRNYKCQCGKTYSHPQSLWNHKTYSSCGKEPQFVCPFCSHWTSRKVTLKMHIALKHAKEDLPQTVPF